MFPRSFFMLFILIYIPISKKIEDVMFSCSNISTQEYTIFTVN